MVKRFFDILLGRSSEPAKPKMEKLFALSTAYVTMTTQMGLEPGERAGICFKPLASAAFEGLRPDLQRLLEISAREAGTKVEAETDAYGYQWAILEDPQFEDLVATIHIFSQTLQEEGFGEQLLAAVFKFEHDGRPAYWIYSYKRGAFYPFVPQHAEGRRRDNAFELRLKATMERELPIEPLVDYWYPLWGVPV